MITKHYAFWYVLIFFIALLPVGLSIAFGGRVDSSTIVVAVIVAAVIPPVLIWLARKMGYPLGEEVRCSRCGTAMPLFRKPASTKQALWGGYRCQNCGAELDMRGREFKADAAR